MDEPATWLTDHATLLPHSGTALDLACGRGRHALWLARRGLSVTAIDRDHDALGQIEDTAASLGLTISTLAVDLEAEAASLGRAHYDVIVCVHYLHRALFPAIIEALRPAGVLVYETFTRSQATLGRPRNPAFLLEEGELEQLVAPLDIVASREGLFDGRHLASVVARGII
ncbi:MAG: methyltransferase domain-containing protein [Vicinamibacterales bacterium]